MGVKLGADGAAELLDRAHEGVAAEGGAGDEIGVAADVFGQRVQHHIDAVSQRFLEQRAEQGVVAHDDGAQALLASGDFLRHDAKLGQIDQAVHGVRGRFHEDHAHPAPGERRGGGGADNGAVDAVGETLGLDMERGQRAGQQGFGAAVKRLAVQDHVARPDVGEQRGRDGGHAGGEDDAGLGALVDGQAVLDDLAVGVVEARIDEARDIASRRGAAAGGIVEEIAALLGVLEHKSRRQEHRRLDGALG